MYWDIAARLNIENEEYQELLELEDVSKGMKESELEKFMKMHEVIKKSKKLIES